LSKEAYLELNEMMARRYVPSIKAYGMTQDLQNYVKFLNKKSYIINKAFRNVNYLAKKKGLKLVSQYNNDVELDFKEYLHAVLDAYDSGKYPGNAKLYLKHIGTNNDGCGKTFTNSYNNLRNNIGNCKYCDSPWKNQQKTHKILEALFNQESNDETYLKDIDDIIDDILTNPIYEEYLEKMDVFRMRLDDYIVLNIKDQNGQFIKLAVESQGPQHYENTKGFKSFLFFNNFDGEVGDLEWRNLYNEWIISLERDDLKRLAFKNNRDKGYYLIAVNNDLSPEERVTYILDTLFKLTKLDLGYLANNNEIKELLKSIT